MKIKKKYLLPTIIVGGLITIGAVVGTSISYAATNPTTNNTFFSRVAQLLGVDNQKLTTALSQASNEKIDQMVKDGKITQIEADKMKQNVVKGEYQIDGQHKGPGRDRVELNDLTTYLGMNKTDLINEFKSGKKLTDIALEKNKNINDIKTYLLNSMNTRVQQEVKDGKITQVQADTRIKKETTEITNLINGEVPFNNISKTK